MLPLLVFPFSLPSSQMIKKKKITVFKNYFFNVEKIWKSYWTASGPSAPPPSQWADGWAHRTQEEPAGSLCRTVLRTSFPGAGCLASTQSLSFQRNPSSPNPIRGMWVLERQSHSGEQSDGNRRGSDRLEALSSGTVSSVLSAAWPQDRKAWLPTERLKSHSHLLHGTSARRLTTFVPLLASELAPGLKKALVQDREAEAAGCITQKGLRTVGFQKQI